MEQLNKLAYILYKMGFKKEAEQIDDLSEERSDQENFAKDKKKKKKKRDACYYKVKSRYKKWPSAYASGALVKCRQVGAKNWGEGGSKKKKSKKKKSKRS